MNININDASGPGLGGGSRVAKHRAVTNFLAPGHEPAVDCYEATPDSVDLPVDAAGVAAANAVGRVPSLGQTTPGANVMRRLFMSAAISAIAALALAPDLSGG